MSNFIQRTSLAMMAATFMLTTSSVSYASAPMCQELFVKAPAAHIQVALRPAEVPKSFPLRILEKIKNWYFKPDPRNLTERPFDYLNDFDYIREKRLSDKFGIVKSVFSKKYDTRIYYTATAAPGPNGEPTVVDPNAKALYIYFHGSGTAKASGGNFSYKMNKMAAMGYSVIGMDMPFHGDGSRSNKMANADKFFASLRDMVNEYRVKGMPVYMVGHSFGPDIAAEFMQRYPFDINGADLISPGGFNEVLEEWYENKTSKMAAAWGDTINNDDGAAWAGKISSQFKWRQPRSAKNPDPTLVNPNLRIRIMSGEWEEYVPGELDDQGLPTKTPRDYDVCKYLLTLFANAKCRIEPGVGHYIFEHKDENGHDVILRELLALDDHTPNDEKQLKDEVKARSQGEATELAVRYAREIFFKTFVDHSYGGAQAVRQIYVGNDVKQARKIINDYNRWVSNQREAALAENIINTKDWNPGFYAQNQKEIAAIDPKKPRASDPLMIKYYELLEQMSPQERALRSQATTAVFTIPERPAPPANIQELRNNQKQVPKAAPAAAQGQQKAS